MNSLGPISGNPPRHQFGRRIRALVIIGASAWSTACAASKTSPEAAPCPALDAVFPGETWERIADPRCVGWSPAGLTDAERTLSTMSTTGLMVIVGGRVLFEYGDPVAVSYLASVRKSVLSMLYGIYVEREAIDLDQTLAQLAIDDVGGLTPAERQATVRHLISARSGVYHEASNGGDDLASAPPRGSQGPGQYYLYSNWDFNAAGSAFEMMTGKSIYDALEEDLVRPLGMRDFDRSIHRRTGDASKSTHLAYHMHLSTRDMARIGYLMLRRGQWNGTRIVPEAWVEESTSAITPVTEMNPPGRRNGPFGYGYLWWVFDGPDTEPVFEGAFAGLGAIGQHILVLPALDMVVAHKTRPGQASGVTHMEFIGVVNQIINARCGDSCMAP